MDGWMDGLGAGIVSASVAGRRAVFSRSLYPSCETEAPLQSVDGRDDDVRTGVSVRCHLDGGSGGLGDGDGARARRLASVWDVRCPNDGMCRQAVCLGSTRSAVRRMTFCVGRWRYCCLPSSRDDFPVVTLWRSRDLKVESTNPSRGLNTHQEQVWHA
jgi:hypothetical protein